MGNHVLTKKNRLFVYAVYFCRKENSPLSSPGNLRLISIYNQKIMSTAIETAV